MIDQVDQGEGYAGLAAKLKAARSLPSKLKAAGAASAPPPAKKRKKKKAEAPKEVSDNEVEVLGYSPVRSPVAGKKRSSQLARSSEKRRLQRSPSPGSSKRACRSQGKEVNHEETSKADVIEPLSDSKGIDREETDHSPSIEAQKRQVADASACTITLEDDDDVIVLCSQSQKREIHPEAQHPSAPHAPCQPDNLESPGVSAHEVPLHDAPSYDEIPLDNDRGDCMNSPSSSFETELRPAIRTQDKSSPACRDFAAEAEKAVLNTENPGFHTVAKQVSEPPPNVASDTLLPKAGRNPVVNQWQAQALMSPYGPAPHLVIELLPAE